MDTEQPEESGIRMKPNWGRVGDKLRRKQGSVVVK